MDHYLTCLSRFLINKLAILVLILSLCGFPMNTYAGGGAGPEGPSDGSDSSKLEIGIWVALMVASIGCLIYSIKHKGKETANQLTLDLSEIDLTNEGLVVNGDSYELVTPEGEFIVYNW